MFRIPTLGAAMTPFPHAVEPGSTVDEARVVMQDHGIRHLPVKDGDELVGVLSDREIDEQKAHVRELLLGEPFTVDIATPLADVVGTMAERRIDCALVLKEGRLAGIFTSIDACRIFSKLLRTLGPLTGDDAA